MRVALIFAFAAVAACDRAPAPRAISELPDTPSPHFRNIAEPTKYVGDSACASCHVSETSAYRQHAMSRTFRPWTRAERTEPVLATPLHHAPSGFDYSVTDSGGRLYQVEQLSSPDGKRLHDLRRRIDYVMGSGEVAMTYFTEENGRLFQLPLTWYRTHGWSFSPGYEVNNARFDRLLPDRCIACHSSYPVTLPHMEGKYAEVRSGIGCERCHGPGALHVQERRAAVPRDSGFDQTIVNPARLPLARRLDTCEQCHVHTAVAVLREGKSEFSFMPSQMLRDQVAYFRTGGTDIVSHADRLKQSACFLETRATARPLECATCHDPHGPPTASRSRNQSCLSCHSPPSLDSRLTRSAALKDHTPAADCVSCHMPKAQVRAPVHVAFTDHRIGVASRDTDRAAATGRATSPIEPYYERDRSGADAGVYQGMGAIVYATLANNGRVMREAAAGLRRALGADTTRASAHFLLGVAEQQIGKSADAARTLERAVRIDSTRPEPLRALALAYEHSGHPVALVLEQYGRALARQPAQAWIRAEYADYLQAQGRVDDAILAYRSALAEQPSLATAWFNLGTTLAEADRPRESSDAFREAVHLDPSLGLALGSLVRVNTSGNVVTDVRALGSPLSALPARAREPRAVQLIVDTAGGRVVRFLNVPANGMVQIFRPDGTLVRALPAGGQWVVSWDLLGERGTPVAGGLYRARVQGRDGAGRQLAPQMISFGIVRQRVE